RDEARVLPRVHHARQVVQRRVDVAPPDRLDQRRRHVIVLVAIPVVPRGRPVNRALKRGERDLAGALPCGARFGGAAGAGGALSGAAGAVPSGGALAGAVLASASVSGAVLAAAVLAGAVLAGAVLLGSGGAGGGFEGGEGAAGVAAG